MFILASILLLILITTFGIMIIFKLTNELITITKAADMEITSLEQHNKKISVVTSIVKENLNISLYLKNGDIIQSENVYDNYEDSFINVNVIKTNDIIEYKNYTYYDYQMNGSFIFHKIIPKENAIKILKVTSK